MISRNDFSAALTISFFCLDCFSFLFLTIILMFSIFFFDLSFYMFRFYPELLFWFYTLADPLFFALLYLASIAVCLFCCFLYFSATIKPPIEYIAVCSAIATTNHQAVCDFCPLSSSHGRCHACLFDRHIACRHSQVSDREPFHAESSGFLPSTSARHAFVFNLHATAAFMQSCILLLPRIHPSRKFQPPCGATLGCSMSLDRSTDRLTSPPKTI